jgi:hypothetical protein
MTDRPDEHLKNVARSFRREYRVINSLEEKRQGGIAPIDPTEAT